MLLEDWLDFIQLELGLEILEIVRVTRRVGTTTSIGEVELVVKDLVARVSPMSCQSNSKENMTKEASNAAAPFHT